MNHEGIWLEKFKRENGYYEDESTVIYVLDNCSSKVIPHCKGKTVYEVTVGDDEDDCDCDDCSECVCKKDEKPTTSSTSTYRVNGEEVDKDTYESALADIEDRYMDNVRDMLLNYCNFMDEVNDWRSSLLRW